MRVRLPENEKETAIKNLPAGPKDAYSTMLSVDEDAGRAEIGLVRQRWDAHSGIALDLQAVR